MSKDNIKIFKFQFDAHIGKLILPVKFACKIKLTWKRSAEITEIEPQPFINGSLNFDRKLTLNVNMYYDTVKEVFLEKKSLFTLIIITDKGEKCAGTVTVDFAEKLNQRVQEYKNVYPLQKCPMKDASLQISLFSHPISEQQLDSMSQMTTAPQTLQQSLIQNNTSGYSQSFFQQDKSERATGDDRSSTLTGQILETGSMSQNILKINDVSVKINEFVTGFSSNLKKQLSKLKQKNRDLQQKLQQSNSQKQQLRTDLNTLKSENKTLKQQIQNNGDQNSQQLQRLNASLIQANLRVQQAEVSKKALQSANLAGQQQKLQYLNQQISKKQQTISRLTESKTQLQQKLGQQRRQTNEYKSQVSNLQQQLQSLKQKYSSLNAIKSELEAERRNNEEEVESVKMRLQKVYQQMVASLKDLI